MKRITPLLLVTALVFSISCLQVLDGTIVFFYEGVLWMSLSLILWIADQFFRYFIKSLKKLWIIEFVFIVIVVLFLWILGLW